MMLAAIALSACAPKPDAASMAVAPMTRQALEYDGLLREFFVFLPSAYDGQTEFPLLVFMHGYGGTATGTEAEVTQGLNFFAEKHGYVVVYPQGTWFMAGDTPETRWTVTSWNHISDGFDTGPAGPICRIEARVSPCPPECGTCGQCGWTSCHDDVGFLRALLQSVSSRYTVGSDSVFVAGFSNGAMMSNRIACEASELFAAAALIGGRLEPGFECTPTRKIPLLQINGGQDNTVPHDGRLSSDGYFYASTQSIAAHWNDGEACAAALQDWRSPAIKGEAVSCTIACGDTDHAAIDCLWPEGDHRWPGTPGIRGSNGYCVTGVQAASMPEQARCLAPDPASEPWGSRLMFEFFDRQRGD